MAITALPKESSAVRCAICARPALRGSTLCAQCKAAVERARHVQRVHAEFLPNRLAAPESGPLSGVLAPSAPRARPDRPAESGAGGWGTYATLVAFGIAVCLTGYLALGELEEASTALHDSLAMRPAAAKRGGDAGGASAPSLAVDEADAAVHVDAAEAVTRVEPGARGPADRKFVREPRQAANITASNASVVGPEPMPVQDGGMAAAPAPAPQEVRDAPEPVADRQQLLAAAFSRCERENAVVGLFCKERARLQYCDGQWGAAPLCPVGVASNNTR
jgi:hypothetical protein